MSADQNFAQTSNEQEATLPVDFEKRREAAGLQIQKLFELNNRCKKNFEHLSLALRYAQKEKIITNAEAEEVERINREANAAKHEGLGSDPLAPVPQIHNENDSPKDGEDLGNCKGELERLYALYMGRPLAKNEPRYRYKPRPGNLGNFTAIVCLNAPQPIEFVGDSYPKKKHAEHSAALQAINFLSLKSLHDPRNSIRTTAVITASTSVDSAEETDPDHRQRRSAQRDQLERQANVAKTEKVHGGSTSNSNSGADYLNVVDSRNIRTQTNNGYRMEAVSTRRSKHNDVEPVKANLRTCVEMKPSMAAEGNSTHTFGILTDKDNLQQKQDMTSVCPSSDIPSQSSGTLSMSLASTAASSCNSEKEKALQDPIKGASASLPSKEAVLSCLQAASRPLALREVFLLSQGKDTKREQMGSGVKKPMNQLLYSMQKEGLVKSADGSWTAS